MERRLEKIKLNALKVNIRDYKECLEENRKVIDGLENDVGSMELTGDERLELQRELDGAQEKSEYIVGQIETFEAYAEDIRKGLE